MRRRTAQTIDKTILLLATLLLASQQYSIPSASFWHHALLHRSYLTLTLIAIVGIFGALTPFEAFSRRSNTERGVTFRRQIMTTLGQLVEIGRTVQPPLDVGDLGLHIWQKKHTFRKPIAGELHRVATYRLGSVPATRQIRPTKGHGVVGLCWLQDQEVGVDVASLAVALSDEHKFIAYRESNGANEVMGFSWQEFDRLKHRGAVFATPIRNGRSKFIGCVSFDADHGYNELNTNRMWHELNSLCVLLGQEGFNFV
jgi:hypothetical protein